MGLTPSPQRDQGRSIVDCGTGKVSVWTYPHGVRQKPEESAFTDLAFQTWSRHGRDFAESTILQAIREASSLLQRRERRERLFVFTGKWFDALSSFPEFPAWKQVDESALVWATRLGADDEARFEALAVHAAVEEAPEVWNDTERKPVGMMIVLSMGAGRGRATFMKNVEKPNAKMRVLLLPGSLDADISANQLDVQGVATAVEEGVFGVSDPRVHLIVMASGMATMLHNRKSTDVQDYKLYTPNEFVEKFSSIVAAVETETPYSKERNDQQNMDMGCAKIGIRFLQSIQRVSLSKGSEVVVIVAKSINNVNLGWQDHLNKEVVPRSIASSSAA